MPAPTLVMATRNAGKVRELRDLLQGLGIELLSLADFPDLPEIPEEGANFAENAGFKAKEVARLTHLPALADDSGLEVEALGGAPGVLSARYAAADGEANSTDPANNARLLREMREVREHERSARRGRGPRHARRSRVGVGGRLARQAARSRAR